MPVTVWISENYDFPHERRAIAEVIKLLKQHFEADGDEYHLICNAMAGHGMIDAILIKPDAVIVLELKNVGCSVSGSESGTWWSESPDGIKFEVKGGSHGNPFLQVRNYRSCLIGILQEHQARFLVPRIGKVDLTHLVATLVVFDTPLKNQSDNIEVAGRHVWFHHTRIDGFIRSVACITTPSLRLTSQEMHRLVKEVFRVSEAKLVDGVPLRSADASGVSAPKSDEAMVQVLKRQAELESKLAAIQETFLPRQMELPANVSEQHETNAAITREAALLKPVRARIAGIARQYGLEIICRNCISDKLPPVLRPVVTRQYVICAKSIAPDTNASELKRSIEQALQKTTSAFVQGAAIYVYWQEGIPLDSVNGEAYFHEIYEIHESSLSLKQKSMALLDVLDRLTKDKTKHEPTQFTGLFSRLRYLCALKRVEIRQIDSLRVHANRIRHEANTVVSGGDYLEDLLSLCEFTAALFETPIPNNLVLAVKDVQHKPRAVFSVHEGQKQKRIIVEKCDGEYIYGYECHKENEGQGELLRVIYKGSAFERMGDMVLAGDQLNLLTPIFIKNKEAWKPSQIVFEPDYLIPVTDVCGCVKEIRSDPAFHLLRRFELVGNKPPLVLGNLAGQFLSDVIVNLDKAAFITSFSKYRHQHALELCTLCFDGTGHTPVSWLAEAQSQFVHVASSVTNVFTSPPYSMNPERTLVESEFICESMGLQGRMDSLYHQSCDDGQHTAVTVELKSGKPAFTGGPQSEHSAQIALYSDVLFYNLNVPKEFCQPILFYSKPNSVFNTPIYTAQIQELVQLRNEMMFNERRLLHGDAQEVFESIEVDQLVACHPPGLAGFVRLKLEAVLNPIWTAEPIAKEYFYHYIQFVMAETFLAKMGDAKIGATQGFAKTWNASVDDKLQSGDILIDLGVKELIETDAIEGMVLSIPQSGEKQEKDLESVANFREGDAVLLYERNSDDDLATNRLIIKGAIESLNSTSIRVLFNYKQRKAILNQQGLYAIEHADADSSKMMFRGLHALLTASPERRDLLLWKNRPATDITRRLNIDLPNEDFEIQKIILEAKQAKDYYLLLGPPGSGKTHVAIRLMTREFYSDPTQNVLLAAYTNQAVDELCSMLDKCSLDYLRIGPTLKCDPQFKCRLLDNIIQVGDSVIDIKARLDPIRIVVGTIHSLSSATSLFELKHFGVAIIDEAAQILEPHLLPLLCLKTSGGNHYFDKFILVGDHKQLPAVVQQSSAQSRIDEGSELRKVGLTNCRNSLYERLYRLNNGNPAGIIGRLTKQSRMHPVVGEFASEWFYDGKLHARGVEHQTKTLEFQNYDSGNAIESFVATHRVGFIPSGAPPIGDSQKINREEARTAALLAQAVYQLYSKNDREFKQTETLGIIVPFRNQIAQIRKELRKLNLPETVTGVTIDTVERFQGSARDVIVFSTTISRPYQKDILSVRGDDEDGDEDASPVDRKLNVAITRAREQLFVTGNAALLREMPIYEDFIAWLIEKGGVWNLDLSKTNLSPQTI